MRTFSLDCPNCGAPLGARPGDTAVVCAHCGSDIRITADREAVPFFHREAAHGPTVDLAAVHRELAAGRKINAVKIVREQTGLGLNEALEYVEALERNDDPPPIAPPGAYTPAGRLVEEVQALLAQGNKIAAIKRYREVEDTSLAEAKAAVEALERGERIPAFAPPRATADAERVEAVRQRMAHMQQQRAGGGGCGRIILGILLFGLLIVGGCGQFVRTSDLHACAVDFISQDNYLRERLGAPVTVSPVLLVMGYSSETDFGGNTDRSMGYFTIARGDLDSAWLYVNAFQTSTDFYGVRFNPVPNSDDVLITRSGQIGDCSQPGG